MFVQRDEGGLLSSSVTAREFGSDMLKLAPTLTLHASKLHQGSRTAQIRIIGCNFILIKVKEELLVYQYCGCARRFLYDQSPRDLWKTLAGQGGCTTLLEGFSTILC